jgi:hypothetical protein
MQFYLITVSTGIPASLEDAMQNTITAVLDRHLGQITHSLDELKDDIRIMKDDIGIMKNDIRGIQADVGILARTAALVSFQFRLHQITPSYFPLY